MTRKRRQSTANPAQEFTINEQSIIDRVGAVLAANSISHTRAQAFSSGREFDTSDPKHEAAWSDFGFKKTLTFIDFYNRYKRSGLATAVVEVVWSRCWKSEPSISDEPKQSEKKSEWTTAACELVDRLELWERLRGLDRRQRVGDYAGLILFVEDGLELTEPLERATDIQGVRPVWQGQLEPTEWDRDRTSPRYGEPIMYNFNEQNVPTGDGGDIQSFAIHHSRVVIWAEGADDGGYRGSSVLESPFNACLAWEKIGGSGAEGYKRAAAGFLRFETKDGFSISELLSAAGVDRPEDLSSKLTEKLKSMYAGYEKAMFTSGVEAKEFNFSVPDPAAFLDWCKSEAAASQGIPVTCIDGHLTGERASTENDDALNRKAESRRELFLDPQIRRFFWRMMDLGVLPRVPDIFVHWPPLSAPTIKEQLELVKIAVEAHDKYSNRTGEPLFTAEEIRALMEREPLGVEDYAEGEEEMIDE